MKADCMPGWLLKSCAHDGDAELDHIGACCDGFKAGPGPDCMRKSGWRFGAPFKKPFIAFIVVSWLAVQT